MLFFVFQVLVGETKKLVYLKIGDGKVEDVKHVDLKHHISCLHIRPIDENYNRIQLAAVGMWGGSVRIYSLPDPTLKTIVEFEGLLRSVLFCCFEGVQVYLTFL